MLYPAAGEAKHDISEHDLNTFFREWSDPSLWRPPSHDQKSYKFTQEAIEAITKGTRAGLTAANKSFDLNLYGAFLKLLVFHVSIPHVNKLKEINQNILKMFLPFYKSMTADKYPHIAEKFTNLFAVTTVASSSAANTTSQHSLQAKWATFDCQRRLLDEVADDVSIDSATASCFGLASNSTDPPWLFLADEISQANKGDDGWNEQQGDPMKIVNIFNADSSPTTITHLKVLTALRSALLTMMRRVLGAKKITASKDSIDETIKYTLKIYKRKHATLMH